MGIKGAYLIYGSIWEYMGVKVIYEKPTANVIPNGKKINVFPSWSGTRQGCSLSPLLFNIVLEVLATVIRKGKEILKRHPNWKEVKLSLFEDYMIVCIESPIYDSVHRKPYSLHQKTTRFLISELGKTMRYKVNMQKWRAFQYTNIDISETETRKIVFIVKTTKMNLVYS